ncbi:ATP-binding cassette domain-containing protein [Desulfotomaculum copahuensis]|uniref:Multidrug ABC transporter ATP-binding protein n=1 Tax=Desulfotomaculum copahuensis TaxID=1838280 RepID=A0A1B7LCQ6_9FIRM|nr:ATP-binding cassette domain-containing protein [Desulfotomaculum copahuensis]OAT80721.1 multidrug ABC transporter ATP-binding protein [Desulfotomaculum copahuensis]
MKAIVRVEQLQKSFGGHVAVNGVSFSIDAGEVFGLLGPNGAGKTTIVRMLTTLLRPDGGRALICGYDTCRQAGRVRQCIGYVPQALSADGTLTGYENMLIFAKLLGLKGVERERRINDMLHFMQLDDAAGRLVRNYSGGMVRRLEISQAVLHYPRVLFLDEPTVGLDPVARKGVWEKLEELRHTYRMAILLTTHYMEEADTVCNRVGILNHGEMVATGTPLELKEKMGDPAASMDDVFTHYTGNQLDTEGGSYRELRQVRRTSRRLG